MDWLKFRKSVPAFVQKYRYAFLVVVLGLILMSVPGRRKPAEQPEAEPPAVTESTEEKLEHILEKIEGAGSVRVLLTESGGSRTVYQTDREGPQDSCRENTVIVTDSQRRETGLIQQVNPPVWQGAVIVCQGAGNDVVRLAVVEAVSCVTGLGADRISVLKMN